MAGPGQSSCWVCNAQVDAEDNYCRNCGAQLVRMQTRHARADEYSNPRMVVGVFLVGVGGILGILSYLMGIVPMSAFGLASFLIGIMILYLQDSSTATEAIAVDSSVSSFLNIENLLRELDLDEKGIYIPVTGFGVSPKVFIPLALTPATKKPPPGLSHSRRIFVTVGTNPEDRGVLLEAPGNRILSAIEGSLGYDLSKAPEGSLLTDLDSAFKAIGVAKVTSLEHEDSELNVELVMTALVDFESKLRNLAPRFSTHVGTPVASALAASISKATASYASITDATLDVHNKKMHVRLKLSK